MTQSFSSAQLRGARAILNWSRADLAARTGLSEPTLHRIENDLNKPNEKTRNKLRDVLEQAGIEFTENDGVKKTSGTVTTLEGFNDFKFFMDQVYEAATKLYSLNGTKPICICNLDNSLFRKYMKDYHAVHVERLKKLKGLQIRSLAAEVDKNHVPGASYLVYRYLKELKSVVAPFYVFGDKFALIDFDARNPPKILLAHSASLAKSYRDQFEIMWKNAFNKPQT